ncbi:tripartite tricarboxylate transporter TctB family protein [Arsenicitalea aurantiaca]|uniref:tripartite tricarboxylate transporter TctB family protein n=1 Tax=Arsenicitalea aurantiaca TaxID=1783274 RepID=UPI00195D7A01|nr:tripartite tricarboxylate transporter TctB family protein [Arsenicitalea aurantiaca]
MHKIDPDLISGMLVALFGLIVAIYAFNHYPMGTLRRMGPGMFPVGLGGLISCLGGALALSALFRRGHVAIPFRFESRTAVLVIVSVAAFALLIRSAGLVPAVIAVVSLSAFADKAATLRSTLVLAVALCALAYVLFRLALGLNLPLLIWPGA